VRLSSYLINDSKKSKYCLEISSINMCLFSIVMLSSTVLFIASATIVLFILGGSYNLHGSKLKGLSMSHIIPPLGLTNSFVPPTLFVITGILAAIASTTLFGQQSIQHRCIDALHANRYDANSSCFSCPRNMILFGYFLLGNPEFFVFPAM